MIKENALINVCAECLCAGCWHGELMCERSRNAGIIKKTVRELKLLGYEHEDNWEHQLEVEGIEDFEYEAN